MSAPKTGPEWDADVMMARPALRLDPDRVELPRFELELSDDDCTLELFLPETLAQDDLVELHEAP